MVKEPPIITTNVWGAYRPHGEIKRVGKPDKTIFHHTAGHHPELAHPKNESIEELFLYAKRIQQFHFTEGWIDSGHNFLVGRNGRILVGRHRTYPAIKNGKMVQSAHCPGQNKNPGIEHEHSGTEQMTQIQFRMSAWLFAWIHDRCSIPAHAIYPHNHFFNTSCPGNLIENLPAFKKLVKEIMDRGEM